ncbi:MAG: GntR family transcriptional regulator [bacterium]
MLIHRNVSTDVLAILKDKIIRRELKPGERIYVNKLIEKFKVSQTPIREALYKLEGMGLVEIRSKMGVYVTQLSKQEITEILDVRIALESLALDKIPSISSDLIQKLKENLQEFEETIRSPDFVLNNEIDEKFHQLIVGASGNRKLAKIYGDLHSHMGIERLFYEDEDKALKELNITLKEHTAIVEAFSKKDKEKIKRKIRDHLENVKKRIPLGINSKEERR